jgi:hypothetical protein
MNGLVSFAYRLRWMNCFLIQRSSAHLCRGSVSAFFKSAGGESAAATLLGFVFWRYPFRISADLLANTRRIFLVLALFTCRYVDNVLQIIDGHVLPNHYLIIIKKNFLPFTERRGWVVGFPDSRKKSWILDPKVYYTGKYVLTVSPNLSSKASYLHSAHHICR